ncbi:MAG: SufD family Fe-S cluster assembly protein [Chlamydiota bacterium]
MADLKDLFTSYLASISELSSFQQKAWNRFCDEYVLKKEDEELFFNNKVLASEKKLSSFDMSMVRLGCDYLVFVDGFFQKHLSSFPECLEIYEEKEAKEIYSHFAINHQKERWREHLFPLYWLQFLFSKAKIWIRVPGKIRLQKPIQMIHIFTQENAWVFPSMQIIAGKESSISFFSTIIGGKTSYVSSIIDFFLEEASKVRYISSQEGGFQDEMVVASVKKEAQLEVKSWNEESNFHRKHYHVFLEGEKGSFHLLEGWKAAQIDKLEVFSCVDHRAPMTISKLLTKGIVTEKSSSSFKGDIWIRSNANLSESSQLNHNLILDEGKATTSPQLRVFVDEVKAVHGSTIAQMEEEELFYLETRGISKEESRILFVEGFLKEITDGFFI